MCGPLDPQQHALLFLNVACGAGYNFADSDSPSIRNYWDTISIRKTAAIIEELKKFGISLDVYPRVSEQNNKTNKRYYDCRTIISEFIHILNIYYTCVAGA